MSTSTPLQSQHTEAMDATRPLKIGIDAHGVGGHSLGLGNETYFKNLISALLAIDPANEYHIFANHPQAIVDVTRDRPNARVVSLVPHSQWIQRPVSVPLYVHRAKLDIVHFPFIRPLFTRAKCVVTVHDINYEPFPEFFPAIERWRMKWLVRRSCAAADLVFTVSEHARQQIHQIYGTPLDKIVVTYNAADHFGDHAEEGRPFTRVPLPNKFFFFAGLIQPKKNLVRLVKAFDLVKSRTDIPHHLVLGGKWGWGNDELTAVLKTLRHRDSIHFVGYLSSREVRSVMLKADAFVFPSVFESFGIPPLEAQQLLVPSLVSNSTCFPEVFGDSALMCDPLNVESIASGMERLVLDQKLRSDLIARGITCTRKFSWESSARVALGAYRRLCRRAEVLS